MTIKVEQVGPQIQGNQQVNRKDRQISQGKGNEIIMDKCQQWIWRIKWGEEGERGTRKGMWDKTAKFVIRGVLWKPNTLESY